MFLLVPAYPDQRALNGWVCVRVCWSTVTAKTNRQLTAVTETEGRGLMLKNDEKNRRTESRNKQDRIKTKLSLMRRVD